MIDYLDIQNLTEGYLLVFNSNQKKEKVSEWITMGEKGLFEVIV